MEKEKDLKQYKELLEEVAELKEEEREKVSIYVQGIMATRKNKTA